MFQTSDGGVSGRSEQVGILIAALAEKNPVERSLARENLVAIGRPAVHPLIQVLDHHTPHVRWEAVKALSSIGDPAAANALVEKLEDEDADVRWVAAEGLIALGRHGLLPLLAVLSDRPKSSALREGAHRVCHHLQNMRSFHCLRSVLAALAEPEPEIAVPRAAADAIDALNKQSQER